MGYTINAFIDIDDFDRDQYDPSSKLAVHRGIAQSGSALALGARCRGFKSLYPERLSR